MTYQVSNSNYMSDLSLKFNPNDMSDLSLMSKSIIMSNLSTDLILRPHFQLQEYF